MERRTERLLLREIADGDWPAVLAYQSTPEYLRYYAWTERTPEAVQEFVRWLAAFQHETPRRTFQFAIVLPESGHLIGNCGLRIRDPDLRAGDIGYEFDPRYWGCGYATEVARAMLALGFDEMGMHRIAAYCIAENVGSARVLEKIGMTREGRFREHERFKGRWWDTLCYAILDHEWRARHAPAL